MGTDIDAVRAHYELGGEAERLAGGLGLVEYLRTTEIIERTLPPAPAVIADIGGGPGRYTDWLVGKGYTVVHRDLLEEHVAAVQNRHGTGVNTGTADARDLDIDDNSVDTVLLLGPLYHLAERSEREAALAETRRILRPEGMLYAAAILRWSVRLHAMLIKRAHHVYPAITDLVDGAEADGFLPPLAPASFTGYTHTPEQLHTELTAAGFEVEGIAGVEGLAIALADLDVRLDDPTERRLLLDTLRAVESIPDVIGVGSHLLATATVRMSGA